VGCSHCATGRRLKRWFQFSNHQRSHLVFYRSCSGADITNKVEGLIKVGSKQNKVEIMEKGKRNRSLYTILFEGIVYLSIVFLIWNLIKGDYLRLPSRIDYGFLGVSLLLLFSGFFIQGLSYGFLLRRFGYSVSYHASFVAFSKNVLTKYIPGKIWMMLGPASHINRMYGYPMSQLVSISFISQFISIWIAISISFGLLVISSVALILKFTAFAVWGMMTLIIFTRLFHDAFGKASNLLLSKAISIPSISFQDTFKVFPVYVIYWLLYGLGFVLLCASLGSKTSMMLVYAFPLATVIGIIAVIVPGGIGIREGILTLMLVDSGIRVEVATAISISSRLWFLSGELFCFALGFLFIFKTKTSTKKKVTDCGDEAY